MNGRSGDMYIHLLDECLAQRYSDELLSMPYITDANLQELNCPSIIFFRVENKQSFHYFCFSFLKLIPQ